MPKITDLPQALSFDEGDVLIKDGTNGTKKIPVSEAAKYMGKDVIMINEEPDTGTKVVIETTDQDYQLALMSDVNSVAGEVDDVKSALIQNDILTQTGSINQWDEEWTNGFYNVNTGEITDNANYIRSKNIIPIAPNTSYFLKTTSNENYLVFFGKDKEYVGKFIASSSASFTTPATAYYIGLGFAGQTYSGTVSINYPSSDHDYHAYDKLHDKDILIGLSEDVPDLDALLTQVNSRSLQQGYTTFVRASNYGDLGITSVYKFGENKFYGILSDITANMISGLPEYGSYATIIKFSPTGSNAFAQYLFTSFTDASGGSIKNVYTSCGTSANSMTPWKRITNEYNGKTFNIISDSWCSFTGWIPSGNDSYYPADSSTVTNVGKTWWYQLSQKMKMSLLVNDSYSGATVSANVRPAHTTDVAFINRVKTTMGATKVTEPKPSVIFVLGGQNDQQTSTTVGDCQYSGWTSSDLEKFAPAFCYLIDYLKTWNPQAEVINLTNGSLQSGYKDAMATACAHYGIKNVVLTDIDQDNMHPTATGMTQILAQVMAAMV